MLLKNGTQTEVGIYSLLEQEKKKQLSWTRSVEMYFDWPITVEYITVCVHVDQCCQEPINRSLYLH